MKNFLITYAITLISLLVIKEFFSYENAVLMGLAMIVAYVLDGNKKDNKED